MLKRIIILLSLDTRKDFSELSLLIREKEGEMPRRGCVTEELWVKPELFAQKYTREKERERWGLVQCISKGSHNTSYFLCSRHCELLGCVSGVLAAISAPSVTNFCDSVLHLWNRDTTSHLGPTRGTLFAKHSKIALEKCYKRAIHCSLL